MNARETLLRERLQTCFQPLALEIRDDGAQHRGHAHAGHGHYSVRITAAAFAAKSPLQRHRMIYSALGDLRQADIHALSIRALAPGESP
jgi:BolA protein